MHNEQLEICFDKCIFTYEVWYATWASLQFMQMVNLREYKFCKLVPQTLLEESMISAKVIWCMAKHFNKLALNEVFTKFEKATGHRLKDLFDGQCDLEKLRSFVKSHNRMFSIDAKDVVRAKDYEDSLVVNPEELLHNRKGKQKRQGEVAVIDLCGTDD